MNLIEIINKKNEKINNLTCNLNITMSKIKVNGMMIMEKPKNFRMKIRSVIGSEMDIGSNNTHFWFWSKRMNPPLLHFAKHENLNKSRLKTPLNPEWLMNSLNINLLEINQLIRYNQYFGIISPKISANNEEITILTLIDPEKQVIIGHYLYGKNNKLQASSEVKSFNIVGEFIVPKEILIIWYDENITMNWTLVNIKLNTKINENNFIMPSMRNSIDMGEK